MPWNVHHAIAFGVVSRWALPTSVPRTIVTVLPLRFICESVKSIDEPFAWLLPELVEGAWNVSTAKVYGDKFVFRAVSKKAAGGSE